MFEVRFCAIPAGSKKRGAIMVSTADSAWYVIRTRQYKERVVVQGVSLLVQDVYLPLFRTKKRGLGRLIERIEPLFPCYLFARFRLEEACYRLTRSVGVVGLVCAGGEPCEVDAQIIQDIKSRETNGLIVLNPQKLLRRQRVTITEGSLRGIEAVFERYLSGGERVAVLLDSIGRGDFKAILRADAIEPIGSCDVA
jgi:transcriptional antiterminator RfaH